MQEANALGLSGDGQARPDALGAASPLQSPGVYGRFLANACRTAAVLGSLVFVGLVLMSLVSITGRKLFAAPVPGDVELLQMCSAFAAASFFAWCHLNGGDVKVDFFTARLPASQIHRLDALGSLLVAAFGGLIAWRALVGALSVREAGETSMILGLPLWWAQILMVPGFALMLAAGLYRAYWHWQQARRAQA